MLLSRNKRESQDLIGRLDLNRITETLFNINDIAMIKEYLSVTDYPFYSVRDMNPSGTFLYSVPKERVLTELKNRNYTEITLSESLYRNDRENLLIQGDICITQKGRMTAALSDERGVSLRYATQNPSQRIDIDLTYDRLPKIYGLHKIIDYIYEKELLGIIVEIGLYNIPVGIKREPIIVWELRNY